ncbi:MAG: ribbon-helix-helix domain-containing protein [Rhodospirillales bacterium]|nr:ribbon-helix-helix domain-containing protein [Rhodospirillales bacterium]MBO6786108.1 ribbon-helix-helix domain-containing protein [Rhodospirillales bacterium]
MIAKRRTTIRLETAVWDALDEICDKEDMSRHELCTRIDSARSEANRAQAVRATVINYFRLAAASGVGMQDAVGRALQGI